MGAEFKSPAALASVWRPSGHCYRSRKVIRWQWPTRQHWDGPSTLHCARLCTWTTSLGWLRSQLPGHPTPVPGSPPRHRLESPICGALQPAAATGSRLMRPLCFRREPHSERFSVLGIWGFVSGIVKQCRWAPCGWLCKCSATPPLTQSRGCLLSPCKPLPV